MACRKCVKALLLISLLLMTAICALAVDPTKSIRQYVHDSWGTNDGLPQNSIHTIVQTKDGYLWFGTEEGLVRFNGAEFSVFNSANSPGLEHNEIMALLADQRDGSLWIGTNGSLTRYNSGQFTPYVPESGSSQIFVTALAQDSLGNLWIGTEAGLTLLKDGKLVPYADQKGLGKRIMALAVDADGSLWAATRFNIFKLGRGTKSQVQFDETIHDPSTLYFDRDGVLWIGTIAHGLYSFSGGNLAHYKTGPRLETTVNTIYQDREGSLWAGLLKGGACRLRAQR